MEKQEEVLTGNQVVLRCKLCGRKLKRYSVTGYGSVCYKKMRRERYRLIPLFKIRSDNDGQN